MATKNSDPEDYDFTFPKIDAILKASRDLEFASKQLREIAVRMRVNNLDNVSGPWKSPLKHWIPSIVSSIGTIKTNLSKKVDMTVPLPQDAYESGPQEATPPVTSEQFDLMMRRIVDGENRQKELAAEVERLKKRKGG